MTFPMPNREESTLFIIVVSTPGGDLSYSSRERSVAVAGGAPSQQMLAACRGYLGVNPQARTGQAVVFGYTRPLGR